MKTNKLLIATRNSKKTKEIRGFFDSEWEVLDVEELEKTGKILPEVDETGTTFLENATLKAEGISRDVAGWVLADDSGLEVDALGGEPGVWSSSFGGEEGNHAKNNERLVLELGKISEEKRTGRFRCVMVLAREGRRVADFSGSVEGRLIADARGAEGFGYDPHFVPEGYEESFAELGLEVKNTMSHRGRALAQVVAFLNQQEHEAV